MNWLSFIFGILCLISLDSVLACLVYLLFKYIDKDKINDTSTNFWRDK